MFLKLQEEMIFKSNKNRNNHSYFHIFLHIIAKKEDFCLKSGKKVDKKRINADNSAIHTYKLVKSINPRNRLSLSLKKCSGRIVKLRKWLALAAAAVLLCGCSDISGREINFTDNSQWGEATNSGAIGGNLLIVTTEKPSETTPAAKTDDNPQRLPDSFTQAQKDFLDSCYFMGDSICAGLGFNGFVKNCSAKAGVAARNIEEFTFDSNGTEVAPLTVLVNSGLNRFVFLMGSNDVNIESKEEYLKYYNSFLSKVEALCPYADIYILNIPPVTPDSAFCYNYQIDEFNEKLKEIEAPDTRRHYVNTAYYLKDQEGSLKQNYSSDNTVHITKDAYYALLLGFCQEVGIE